MARFALRSNSSCMEPVPSMEATPMLKLFVILTSLTITAAFKMLTNSEANSAISRISLGSVVYTMNSPIDILP